MDPLTSTEVVPRPASSVLAVRSTPARFEVLMVRRTREASFMGGAHVFPGGAIDEVDHSPAAAEVVRWSGDPAELPWRAAALRELAEEAGLIPGADGVDVGPDRGFYPILREAGITLDGASLAWVSNWVTPRGMSRRFDTRFYLLEVPPGTTARSDEGEVHDAVWVDPVEALAAADSGRWQVEFPTRAHLEMLAACPDIASARALAGIPSRIEPRLIVDPSGAWSVLLPGDPGYEEQP